MTYIHTFALSSLEFQRKQRRNKKEERKLFHETDKDAIPKDKGCSGLEGAHNMLFSVTNFSVQSIFQFRCCVAKKQCLLLETQVFKNVHYCTCFGISSQKHKDPHFSWKCRMRNFLFSFGLPVYELWPVSFRIRSTKSYRINCYGASLSKLGMFA